MLFEPANKLQPTAVFEDPGGKTKLTGIFDAEKENEVEMQKEGRQAIPDNFKKYGEPHG